MKQHNLFSFFAIMYTDPFTDKTRTEEKKVIVVRNKKKNIVSAALKPAPSYNLTLC